MSIDRLKMTGRVPFELERWKLPLCAAANRYWCLFVSRKLIRPPLSEKVVPIRRASFQAYLRVPPDRQCQRDRQADAVSDLWRSRSCPLRFANLDVSCNSRVFSGAGLPKAQNRHPAPSRRFKTDDSGQNRSQRRTDLMCRPRLTSPHGLTEVKVTRM